MLRTKTYITFFTPPMIKRNRAAKIRTVIMLTALGTVRRISSLGFAPSNNQPNREIKAHCVRLADKRHVRAWLLWGVLNANYHSGNIYSQNDRDKNEHTCNNSKTLG